eukprot:RCo041022
MLVSVFFGVGCRLFLLLFKACVNWSHFVVATVFLRRRLARPRRCIHHPSAQMSPLRRRGTKIEKVPLMRVLFCAPNVAHSALPSPPPTLFTRRHHTPRLFLGNRPVGMRCSSSPIHFALFPSSTPFSMEDHQLPAQALRAHSAEFV